MTTATHLYKKMLEREQYSFFLNQLSNKVYFYFVVDVSPNLLLFNCTSLIRYLGLDMIHTDL